MNKRKKAALTTAHSLNLHDKGNGLDRDIQLIRVRKCFSECPKTMRQVATELGEERSNICWYCMMLRDRQQIQVHHRGECEVTGRTVKYYTTNKALFIKSVDPQLPLFPEGGEQ